MLALTAAVALFAHPAWDRTVRQSVPMRFLCVDEDGKPVAGAGLSANMSGDGFIANQNLTAGADGGVVARRPTAATDVRVWVDAPGFAGVSRAWDPTGGQLPPAESTFVLPKATAIGGRVVDATGHGVAGVRVEARCDVPPGKLANGARFNTFLALGDGAPTTDAQGNWRLENVPAPATKFQLRFEHPDYISDVRYSELQRRSGVTDAQLRARTAVVSLEAGARAFGTITGPDGEPAAGALVIFHDSPFMTPGSQEVRADAQGTYALPALRPGRHPVTVVARGLRPERRELVLEAGSRVEDFRLAAGLPLTVKAVDEQGHPIPGASFAIKSWRGSEALYNINHPDVTSSGIPNVAKADGVYRWAGTPADAVEFAVVAKGYQTKIVELTARDGVQTVVLAPAAFTAGKLIDAATGKAIEGGRVVPVVDFDGGLYAVRRDLTVPAKGGAYSVELWQSNADYRLLVEAPGYRGVVSRPRLVRDRVTSLDFRLEPAAPVAGRVLDPGGKPVAGAKVSLATAVEEAVIPARDGKNLTATTDAAGAFTLPAQSGRFVLFAEHAAGWARADLGRDDAAGDLRLRPWASVAGSVRQDGKPVAGESVCLNPMGRPGSGPNVRVDYSARTGEDGTFRFDRVVPGPAYLFVVPRFRLADSPLTAIESVPLDPKPGDARRVDFGNIGASVAGRFALAGEPPPGVAFDYSVNQLVRRTPDIAVPGVAAPPGVDLTKSYDPRRLAEPDARDWLRTHRRFTVRATPAGEFRASGVPAGDYWLVARVFEGQHGGCLVNPCGTAVAPVTVTESQASGGERVEVGAVTVVAHRGPRAGDPLPKLDLRDAAGDPIGLAKFRGRKLLLHGWAGWCANCPRDYPAIRKLRSELPADKLAIIGLNLDPAAADCALLATKYTFTWPQACLGTKAAEPTAAKLAVARPRPRPARCRCTSWSTRPAW